MEDYGTTTKANPERQVYKSKMFIIITKYEIL
jgi:hypothetical protein